ncbi:MAG: tetratricopeptide repeat protein [Bacteroidota bacterium]
MMIHRFGFLILVPIAIGMVFFVSCNNDTTTQKQEIVVKKDSVLEPLDECTKLFNEAKMNDDILLRATVLNEDVAQKAMIAFYNYANLCKKDSLAPVFLVKAGQVAQSIGKYSQAQAFFVKCKDEFVDFKNRGAALFLLAQLYDDPMKLNNEPEARKIYNQIIREYPESSFASDSKAAIQNLGKTDEQLVQEFLKKNK